MKTIFNRYVAMMIALAYGFSASAQSSDEPAIVIKTNAYANDGAQNVFNLMIGANTAEQYVDVDCGFGN